MKKVCPAGSQCDEPKIYSLSEWSHFFLCFGGRFRLSAMTRVTAGAIPDFRARRRASLPASSTNFFRFFILAALGGGFSGV